MIYHCINEMTKTNTIIILLFRIGKLSTTTNFGAIRDKNWCIIRFLYMVVQTTIDGDLWGNSIHLFLFLTTTHQIVKGYRDKIHYSVSYEMTNTESRPARLGCRIHFTPKSKQDWRGHIFEEANGMCNKKKSS